jgi:hypothetical protein
MIAAEVASLAAAFRHNSCLPMVALGHLVIPGNPRVPASHIQIGTVISHASPSGRQSNSI